MEIYISQKEYDGFSKKLSDLEKEREKLNRTLGEIMETSSSFASKTPGFNETENQVKIFNKKILDIKNLLSKAKIINDLSEFRQDKVTIYSLVSVLDIDVNKEIKYYIQRDFSDNKKDFVIITPFSPIGKSLMGKKIGDEVEVEIPRGNLKLKIINIEKKLL